MVALYFIVIIIIISMCNLLLVICQMKIYGLSNIETACLLFAFLKVIGVITLKSCCLSMILLLFLASVGDMPTKILWPLV